MNPCGEGFTLVFLTPLESKIRVANSQSVAAYLNGTLVSISAYYAGKAKAKSKATFACCLLMDQITLTNIGCLVAPSVVDGHLQCSQF